MRADKASLVKANSRNSATIMRMTTKVKPSGKLYNRKKSKCKNLD